MIEAQTRIIGPVNWLGMWTLYVKEVQRFMKVPLQTIGAPVIGSVLFLAVFALAFGNRVQSIHGASYLDYIVPGLIMMAVIQNAFANTSSSLIISKIQGNIVDVLMPPLSAAELTFAYAIGGATRGLMVAIIVGIAMAPIASIGIVNVVAALYFAGAASLMLSLLGLATGIWADKFDNLATVTNFLITPLAFLSGTFYSVRQLPDIWFTISHFDPFFYAIDGFRFGMLGIADSNVWLGAAVLAAINVALWVMCHQMFVRGYKLKS
jgi:ABC-2 type transport system permease protein